MYGEKAGLASITMEGDQIVFRYPALPGGVIARDLPSLGSHIRAGKNAYWMRVDLSNEEWRTKLLEVVSAIIKK